jgi:FHS family L-fucose permease-like MFS transporter
MTTQKNNASRLMPVLMSFFVMSFIDMVGIGVDKVKLDFNLSNTMVQLIPSAAFLWFFILSLPVGILQDRIGKRMMVNIGMIITALGLFVPFLFNSFGLMLVGFAMLGIGNTIVQVSANPLLIDVVPSNRTSSYLSFSQFIKAIGSMIAPPLATWFALRYGNWKILFLVSGIVSLLTVAWLSTIKIEESRNLEKRATFGSSFKLLGTRFIAMMVMCIFLIVGIDVGVNTVSGQFLHQKFGVSQAFSDSGRSIYFFGKMLGTFGGALLLTMLPSRKFFLWSSILALLSVLALLVVPTAMIAMVIIFIIGLGVANIFPLVFSITVEKYPVRSNEISGLMIMAVSGGAVIPVLIGWVMDISDSVTVGLWVLVACAVYELLAAVYNLKKN